jgi:hypothetical protein
MKRLKTMMKVKFYGKSSWLKDAGYTLEEEEKLYDEMLKDVLRNTRWYLDNLDTLHPFRVRWHTYSRVKSTPLPYKLAISKKAL